MVVPAVKAPVVLLIVPIVVGVIDQVPPAVPPVCWNVTEVLMLVNITLVVVLTAPLGIISPVVD